MICMIVLLCYAMSAALVTVAVMAAAAAVNAAMAATHLQPTTVTHPLEPINAVKLLADFDPQFSGYMKVE